MRVNRVTRGQPMPTDAGPPRVSPRLYRMTAPVRIEMIEMHDLGDAGHLAADRLDEARDEPIEAICRHLDVVIRSIDGALDRPRVVALDHDRLAAGDLIRPRDPARTRREDVLAVAGWVHE